MLSFSAPFLTGLLAGLSRTFEEPSDRYPSTRCIGRGDLISLLLELSDQLEGPVVGVEKRRPSARAMLATLREAGVARPMPVETVSPRWGSEWLWCIGLGITPDEVTPPEILQAIEPSGALCYQSAIEVHGLTTQLATVHHIARARPTQTKAPGTIAASAATAVAAPPPLGRPLFNWRGAGYFVTQRDPRYFTDVEHKRIAQFAWFRVTTLEQTLIDTLHRPGHCGGLDVVFECWESAAPRVDAERLARVVLSIGDELLKRRVGWMMEQHGVGEGAALDSLRGNGQLTHSNDPSQWPALFGGMPLDRVDRNWRLRVP